MLNFRNLGKLLGGGADSKRSLSAREALPLAQDALAAWSPVQAANAQLCCVYTSPEEANRELQWDGLCRGWHVDFYLPGSQTFYLVRVLDGKAKGWERKNTGKPVEYIYALYGGSGFANPVSFPEGWVDSTTMAQQARAALEQHMQDLAPEDLADFHLLTLVYLAPYLRYLHPEWTPRLLQEPAPEAPCCAMIAAHVDADCHDALAVYVDVLQGETLACERFRFKAYSMVGSSFDW